jgi:hypothetical protein
MWVGSILGAKRWARIFFEPFPGGGLLGFFFGSALANPQAGGDERERA